MPAQLPICVPTRKAPLDAASSGVAPPLPRCHRGGEDSLLGGAARQALALQNTDFDLGHIQPARMLGRVVELDPTQQCRGGLHAEHFVEALAQMRVEVVQDQVDLADVGVPAAQHPADEVDEIDLGAPGSDLCEAPLTTGLDGNKDIAGTGPLILVILLGRYCGLRGQRATSLAQQLLAFLVQTNHRLARIVGTSIQIQQLVHAPAVLCGEFANAPHQLAPGFEEVFFRIRRMVSRLIVFIWGWRRAASVSSATVQRRAPDGGSEQASAVTCASACAGYRLGLPGRASSWSAKSTPPCRYAERVRQMAVRPTLRSSMICCSDTLESSAARIWARLNSRAMCRPLERNSSTIRRSRLFKLSAVCRMPDTSVYPRYAQV